MNRAPRSWRVSPALTLSEAASVLGISRSKVYEMAAASQVRTFSDHLGRQRVKPSDLELLLAVAQTDGQLDLFRGDDL